MKCAIYKGSKKADTYLFVEREGDFSRVPPALLALMGRLELVMSIELGPSRRLAQADAGAVMEQLQASGYYLQMPPEPLMGRPPVYN